MHTCESVSQRSVWWCLLFFLVLLVFSPEDAGSFFPHENGGKMHRRQFIALSLYLPKSSVLQSELYFFRESDILCALLLIFLLTPLLIVTKAQLTFQVMVVLYQIGCCTAGFGNLTLSMQSVISRYLALHCSNSITSVVRKQHQNWDEHFDGQSQSCS